MKKDRIVIIDSLRGLALLLIIVVHFTFHFGCNGPLDESSFFISSFDQPFSDFIHFFLSNKVYNIFALLFGFSLQMLMTKAENQKINYKKRCLWRMFLLFIFGIVNSLLFRGYMLQFYAVLSVLIIFLHHVKTKYLWLLVFLFLSQTPYLLHLIASSKISLYPFPILFEGYTKEGHELFTTGSIQEVVGYNVWKGKITAWSNLINGGRPSQTLALFIMGMLFYRQRVFSKLEHPNVRSLLIALTGFVLLFIFSLFLKNTLPHSSLGWTLNFFFTLALDTYNNIFFSLSIGACFVLLYWNFKNGYFFKILPVFGKMSLTNYVLQNIIGVLLFYHFGFGLYKTFGPIWSMILGLVVFITQALFSFYWTKRYYYGPLEWAWRCATIKDFSIPLRRRKENDSL